MIQFQGQGEGSCQAMVPPPPRLLRPQPQKGEKWSQTVKKHPHFVADRKLFTNFATDSGTMAEATPMTSLLRKAFIDALFFGISRISHSYRNNPKTKQR